MRFDSSKRHPRCPCCIRARRRFSDAGFTLLEILVAIAIVGLLAVLAITSVDRIYNNAQVSTAQAFVRQTLKLSLFTYRSDMSDYPSTQDGLQALAAKPATKAEKWHGPYIEDARIPPDPWGEPYQYAWPGKHNKERPDIWSKGPDKTDGTADDIGNWDAAAVVAGVPK